MSLWTRMCSLRVSRDQPSVASIEGTIEAATKRRREHGSIVEPTSKAKLARSQAMSPNGVHVGPQRGGYRGTSV